MSTDDFLIPHANDPEPEQDLPEREPEPDESTLDGDDLGYTPYGREGMELTIPQDPDY